MTNFVLDTSFFLMNIGFMIEFRHVLRDVCSLLEKNHRWYPGG